MTTCTIGSGITNMSKGVFGGCSGLTSLTVKATTPPTIENNTLYNSLGHYIVYVPSESVDAYKEAKHWRVVANYIQAIP
jgi:hypothetical protein